MKKFAVLTVALLFVFALTGRADNDRPIAVDQLPQKAQQFIKQHFPKLKVALAKEEREFLDLRYEVVFANSVKIEFLKDGEWKEVDCKYSAVPAAIVPVKIAEYVAKNYEDVQIVKIDRDKREYEVDLSNGLELTFDTKFNLIDIDD